MTAEHRDIDELHRLPAVPSSTQRTSERRRFVAGPGPTVRLRSGASVRVHAVKQVLEGTAVLALVVLALFVVMLLWYWLGGAVQPDLLNDCPTNVPDC